MKLSNGSMGLSRCTRSLDDSYIAVCWFPQARTPCPIISHAQDAVENIPSLKLLGQIVSVTVLAHWIMIAAGIMTLCAKTKDWHQGKDNLTGPQSMIVINSLLGVLVCSSRWVSLDDPRFSPCFYAPLQENVSICNSAVFRSPFYPIVNGVLGVFIWLK